MIFAVRKCIKCVIDLLHLAQSAQFIVIFLLTSTSRVYARHPALIVTSPVQTPTTVRADYHCGHGSACPMSAHGPAHQLHVVLFSMHH